MFRAYRVQEFDSHCAKSGRGLGFGIWSLGCLGFWAYFQLWCSCSVILAGFRVWGFMDDVTCATSDCQGSGCRMQQLRS